MPVAIKIISAGTAILLNLFPTLIIICILSCTELVIVFRSGENTIPIKSEPPTLIVAETR